MVSSLEQYQASFAVESGYLNWASFGPLSPIVQEESRADLELLGSGRPSSLNLVVERAESAREHIAAVLGVDASGVTLQPSTTHGLMQAAFGVTGGIVLSRDEFPSLPVAVTRAAEALHVGRDNRLRTLSQELRLEGRLGQARTTATKGAPK